MSRIRSLALLLILMALAATAMARPSTEATVLDANLNGMKLQVAVHPDSSVWRGLVAIPAGKQASLSTASSAVEMGPLAIMHGVRLAPLTVHLPANESRTVELDLAFSADPVAKIDERTQLAATFANLLESQALGGAMLRQEFDVVPGTYLMILPDVSGVEDAVEPLLQWRREQGYNVIVASTLQIGGSNVDIKEYIQQVYDTVEPPLAYVSLVGDATGGVMVPTWRENLTGYHGEGDHYYVTLEGNDVLADAHVGRLTARSISELEGIVAKIVTYERNPDTFVDPGWFTRATLAGDPSSSGATTIYVNQWLKEQHLERLGYTQIDTIWTGPFATGIYNSLNQGASVYSYRGYLGCSGFSTGHIDNLSNVGELPFAVMTTCASGSFANDTHGYTEAMLRNPHGGAIGAVGTATTGTHTRYNNCYFHGTWDGALGEPDRHLGYAHTRGKLELYLQYQAAEPNIVEIWAVWNNLMGDPATEMRQAVPHGVHVSSPTALPAGAGSIPVRVTTGSGMPLADSRVGLSQGTTLLASGFTDDNGELLLPLTSSIEPGQLRLTVTGDDLIPYRGLVTVGSDDPYCVAVDWTWDDGMNDHPEPGDTGMMTLQVSNLGEDTAQDVIVSLNSRTEGVTVRHYLAELGDLPAGATVPASEWEVSLPADQPNASTVVFELEAVASNGEWFSRVELPVTAPDFVITNSQWTGQPGQTTTLVVSMRNAGSMGALGAAATIDPGSPLLMPAGPVTDQLGDAATGDQVAATFELATSAAAYNGLLAPATITVTTITGFRQTLELPLSVGSVNSDSPVGPGPGGILAWDNADPVADAPVYWWRELDPNHGGNGTSVGLEDNGYEQDDTKTVDLPFPFQFQGEEFQQLSICSNGWASFGQTSLVHYRNWGLPAAGVPDNILAVFWDDLEQDFSNKVYHHHDADAGIYVVQWSRMRNRHNGVNNFELILYDPAVHPTDSGDGLIVYQYEMVMNNDNSRGYATVGLQSGREGLGYTYYNRYAPGARTLQAGMAIAFVPTGEFLPASPSIEPAALDIQLAPGASTTVSLDLLASGPVGSNLIWQAGIREIERGRDAEAEASRERSVTLIAPNGGEEWLVGEQRVVEWDNSDEVTSIRLQIDRGQGEGWESLADSVPAWLTQWAWTVTGPQSAACRLRIVDNGDVLVADVSDGTFSIASDLSWFAVWPLAGEIVTGGSTEIEVTIDAANLALGEHLVDLLIMHPGGEPLVVPVRVVVSEVSATPDALPNVVTLGQNVPNPFNPQTQIEFSLPTKATAQLTIHDLRGRLVRTLRSGTLEAGTHQVTFDGKGDDGRRLASGVYVYRLRAGGETQVRRLSLVK